MKRSIRVATAALVLASGLGSIGCASRTGVTAGDRYRNAVDTTWPEHYNYAARQAVVGPFAQQAANGHFINQTIWNWYFEPGTDKLNPAGIEKLDSLARATPAPDTRIYLQAARDILVTPENTDKVAGLRDDLTARRAAAVQKYMGTQPGNTVNYEIAVHDMPSPQLPAAFAASAFRGQAQGYRGGLSSGAGGATSVSGGGNLNQSAPGSGTAPGGGGPGGGGPGGGGTGGGNTGGGY